MSLERTIEHECKIVLRDVPIQWMPKFEFYYPDLPGYPIVYVHFVKDGKRVFGFPSEIKFNQNAEGYDAEIVFLSNVNLNDDESLRDETRKELENRFGLSDKFGLEELLACCNDDEFRELFKKLWESTEKVFGKYIPYGRFYEKVFSIIRFVAAWVPKTGRQSEMRMLYNFMSLCGEKIEIRGKWDFLHFFVIPTYDEIRSGSLDDFPKFKELFEVLEKVWKAYFTKRISENGVTIRGMQGKWPDKKQEFISKVSTPMLSHEDPALRINLRQKFVLEQLVDVFNRNGTRTSFFVWSLMTSRENDYDSWDKNYFINFYVDAAKKAVGVSQKVVACFLQQGFGKSEFIPIDTWVESFQKGPIGIEDPKKFLQTFNAMGKMERIIWAVSQAKKTNISEFFNILWCIRFGDTGNNEIRGANPISCYTCSLKDKCPGYKSIKDKKVLIVNDSEVEIHDVLVGSSGKSKGRSINEGTVTTKANDSGASFICVLEHGIPKKIFAARGTRPRRWKLIDEFSGYRLDSQTTSLSGNVQVKDLISGLPSFDPSSSSTIIIDE